MLTLLWTALLLADSKFHGKSEVYTKYASKLHFKNIPRTQGLVELHHKVTKEITLNAISKRQVDTVIQSLYNGNIVKHRQRIRYKGKESYDSLNANPFLLKKTAMNHPYRIKITKTL